MNEGEKKRGGNLGCFINATINFSFSRSIRSFVFLVVSRAGFFGPIRGDA
jgi:hypothetical protein